VKIAGFSLGGWIYPSLLIVIACLLAACSETQQTSGIGSLDDGIYRPPVSTLDHTPAKPSISSLNQSTPTILSDQIQTPTPFCSNNLLFIEDLTIPDGAIVSPGAVIDKQWSVENNGTCNWDDRYRVRLVAGLEMGARLEQALYPARSGTQSTIRILFTAPLDTGTYRSAWQAYSPEDLPFGDPFFIEISVENP